MKLFDREGMPIEIPDELVCIKCFFCELYLKEKGAELISPPEEQYGDGVDKLDRVYLCKKCYNIVIDFLMGRVEEVEVPPKLAMILESLKENKMTTAMRQCTDLLEMLKKGQQVKT